MVTEQTTIFREATSGEERAMEANESKGVGRNEA